MRCCAWRWGLRRQGATTGWCGTRKPELIAAGTVVWDVGSEFDPVTNRFDHHQRGAPLREDGTPFSSAGLIWQVYGERAVAALLRPVGAEAFAATIAAELDESVVRRDR